MVELLPDPDPHQDIFKMDHESDESDEERFENNTEVFIRKLKESWLP